MKSVILTGRKVLFVLMTLAALLISGSAYAQTAKGKVLDSAGIPIIGASVMIQGTTVGVVTSVDGSFEIKAAAGTTLEVACLGYVPKAVTAAPNMSIVLEDDSQLLEETVVIGYGSVKKSDLTSSVASMNSSSIDDRPMARAEQALQGQLAGVQVQITNAEPGASPQIRVRGSASISAGNDPLYVIDGVPATSMSGLNPNDVANIEVLKDAASAAIYGSRGSNGVVIVTTKQGKKGAPKVSFNATYGISTLEKKLDLLSATEWMEFYIKFVDATYLTLYPSGSISDNNATRMRNVGQTSPVYRNASKGVIFDDRWFQYMSDDMKATHTYTATDEELSLNDWQEYMYTPAATQNYNVTVSGASESTKYMYSLGYLDQDGLAAASNYKRINVRTNIETKISDLFTVGLNIAPSYVINTGSGQANGKDRQTHAVLSSPPVSGPGVGYYNNYYPNVSYLFGGSTAYNKDYYESIAPVTKSFGLQASTFLRFTPIKDLSVTATASANYSNSDTHQFSNGTLIGSNWLTKPEGAASSASHSTSYNINSLMQVVANYNKSFGKHNLDLMLGASAEINGIGFSTSQSFNNLPNDTITGTFSGSGASTSPYVKSTSVTQSTESRLLSLFGRAQYNYASKYLLSASLRYDGYSRFGVNNKWGWFPSVSGGWLVSSEPFFKDLDFSWWNTFKLRASYGETGNNGVSQSAAYSTLTGGTYADQIAYYAGSFGNTSLGWEKTHSTDLAADLAFLNNRIQLSLDWYSKTTTGLLYSVPVPSTFGTTTTTDNLGSVYNSGFEVELNTHNLTGEFVWNTSFNVSYNRNKVISLGATDTPVYNNSNGAINVLMVDHPMYEFFGFKCDGVWMNQREIDDYIAQTGNVPKWNSTPVKPGDLKYRDITGDGNVTDDDRMFLGKPSPDFTFGMTNTFKWKNWDASILFTAQTGGSIYGALARAIDRANVIGPGANQMGWWTDCWWSESDPGNGWLPSVKSTVSTNVDSRFIHSSNYLRLKNLTIGYKIPFKKVVNSARVYLSAENLFILDSYYHGYSPEAANNGKAGIDYGAYPSARTFTMGVNINF